MSAGTWRKRGALKLKRENDRLKRELNFATEHQVTVQTVRPERIIARMDLRAASFAMDPVRGRTIDAVAYDFLCREIFDQLKKSGAIRLERDDSTGYPGIRAELNIVREGVAYAAY